MIQSLFLLSSSGEKPYECSNCKKRFSHSGSYSSHISSKKCIGLISINGRVRHGVGTKSGSSPNSAASSPGSPALAQLRSKLENSRCTSLQDPLVHPDIKAEPIDFNDCHIMMTSPPEFGGPAAFLNSTGRGGSPLGMHNSSQNPLQHLAMRLDSHALGYPGLSNNLTKVQRVLQIVDNTVCRQKLDGNPDETSKLRAYMKDLGSQMEEHKLALASQPGFHGIGHNSPNKSIIDYTLEKVNKAKISPQSQNEDAEKRALDIKKERPSHIIDDNLDEKERDGHYTSFSCQYCKESFSGPIPLHQHERYLCKMNEEIKAVLKPNESLPVSRRGVSGIEQQGVMLSSSMPDRNTTSPVNLLKDHLSVLKAYFAMNTDPSSEELRKISIAVGLPQEFVKELFIQWKAQSLHGVSRKRSPPPEWGSADSIHGLARESALARSPTSTGQYSESAAELQGNANGETGHRLSKHYQLPNIRHINEKTADSMDHLRGETPSPLNLSSTSSKHSHSSSYTPTSLTSEDAHGEPLDLSLPKQLSKSDRKPKSNGFNIDGHGEPATREQGTEPLDLAHIKKEFNGLNSIGNENQLDKSSSPIFSINPFSGGPIYTPLPPHGAFPPSTFLSPAQASIPGLRPYPGLDPMGFLPHMAYTYAAGAATFAEMQQRRKYQRKPGFQVNLILG